MSFPEALQKITAALDHTGVAYMLTGSFASAYYGSLRSTQDIGLVISATPPQFQASIQSLPSDEYYADLDAALEAHKRESLFNVIDMKTSWKIDMIICKSRAFSQEEFARRRQRAGPLLSPTMDSRARLGEGMNRCAARSRYFRSQYLSRMNSPIEP